jgi:hypothetical protein
MQLLVGLYLQAENYQEALPVIRAQVRLFPDKQTYQNQLTMVERKIQEAQ